MITIKENFSLKPYNTFQINVAANFFSTVSSIDDVKEIVSEKKFRESEKLILGGGSNILFTKNYDGLVIKNNLKGIKIVDPTGIVLSLLM